MKKLNKLSFLFLLVFSTAVFSQKVEISPVPQSVIWGEKAFDNRTSYSIVGEKTADKDGVAALKSGVTVGKKGIKIIIGEKGDAAVNSVKALIPDKKEGYFLRIEPKKVIIAGNDSVGTFYGVQTFLQLIAAPEVPRVTITDYPDVPERGVVEGFYGNPFSQADRISQFRFYGKNKMNAYVYGPKDDPYHGFGDKWREPYPEKQAADIKVLIDEAHRNKVNFIWAVHPGNNISWTDKDGDGVIDDFKACAAKFEKMYELGVRAFAVFFDDIGGVGTDPVNQAKMMNYLHDNFVDKKHDVQPLILCPTQYNQAWSGGNYLDVLGTEMHPSVRIMWTGKSVVRMIDKETMDWINARIKREAYIWLNYPVTDYVIDHLLMGPVYGNDLTITPQLSGFVANPMEYAEASKVALFSIADYCWNMSAYDADASWRRSVKFLMPKNYDSFKVFCENNIDLGSTGHGLRREGESATFKKAADDFMTSFNNGVFCQEKAEKLTAFFRSFSAASAELMASDYNAALREEIRPWLQVFDLMGKKGVALMEMNAALNRSDSVAFIQTYQKIEQLDKKQSEIRSRDFPGSIKSPYPKPTNEVVAPFIKELKNELIKKYRGKFNYKTDIFPKTVLESGRYFIRYQGKYLTNVNNAEAAVNPAFVAERDTINPARQEWLVTIDYSTDRYKIVNAQDSRYINELGKLTTRPYNALWNTYLLTTENGKFAIQNAGNAKDKFWKIEQDMIKQSDTNKSNGENFVFEIIPVGKE